MDGRGKFVAAPRPPQGAGSLERVFSDFCARRAGLIKALTTDAKEFRMACDPGKDNLCLYGLPNKQWVVKLPPQLVPPELPEPVLGINFSRDGTSEKDWMSLVAIHSDSWLLSVAFYSGTKLRLDRESRDQLFSMINDLPTVYEVFKENAKKESKEQTPESSSKGNTSGSKPSGPSRQLEPNSVSMMQPPKDEEESADQETEVCGACFKYHGQDHGENLFWIFCDVCEKWFHGACVNITPAYAALIKMYMCPSCRTSGKRAKSSA